MVAMAPFALEVEFVVLSLSLFLKIMLMRLIIFARSYNFVSQTNSALRSVLDIVSQVGAVEKMARMSGR